MLSNSVLVLLTTSLVRSEHTWHAPEPDHVCYENIDNCGGAKEAFDDDPDTDWVDFGHERVKRELTFYKTGKALTSQVSSALDDLLLHSGYDKRIRPQVHTLTLVHHQSCPLSLSRHPR